MHRKAHDLFSEVEGITKVEIYLLYGEQKAKTSITFPAYEDEQATATYGSVTLTGDDLDKFLEIWMAQTPCLLMSGFCHDPVYGIRLYRSSRVVAETDMCWECSNFTVKVWPWQGNMYGFDAQGKYGQKLLAFCDSRLPYHRPPPRPPKPSPKGDVSPNPSPVPGR